MYLRVKSMSIIEMSLKHEFPQLFQKKYCFHYSKKLTQAYILSMHSVKTTFW